MKLYEHPALEIRDKIAKGEFKVYDLISSLFERVDKVNKKLNCFITIDKDRAIEAAKEIDEKIEKGRPLGKLAGVPITIKDNISTSELLTTAGSRILHNFVPPYDAYVVRRIKEEDGIIIGKTNLDEFAMGSSCETSYFGNAKNPWDLERVPGGSSGGAAASCAAGLGVLHLGSDTGGSVRQPAAFCGVVGFKPTYGRVSRNGLLAFASSLDQIGPITRNVQDCAYLMNVIAGKDRMDSTSIDMPVPDFLDGIDENVKGLKLGVPKEYFTDAIDEEVRNAVASAIKVYEKLGAKVKEISLPHTDYAISSYYIVAPAEASSNLARYDGVHYGHRTENPKDLIDMYCRTRSDGFGQEVKRRIMLGTYVLSTGYYEAYYLKALKVRRLIKEEYEAAFKTVDAIICPTSPTCAFKIGEKIDDPLQMYLNDILTVAASLAGIPAISIPCGFSKEGLPIGLQILGKAFEDKKVLQVARAYEKETDWHLKRPRLEK